MDCPHCQAALEDEPGSFCAACGGALRSVPSEPAPAVPLALSEAPRCAVHSHRPTRQVCGRCGLFACGECLRVSRAGAAICATCAERTNEGAVPIPWEDRAGSGFLVAYLKTTAAVMLRPGKTFREAPPATGRWWDPISYALLSWLLPVLGWAALTLSSMAPLLTGKLKSADLPFAAGHLLSATVVALALYPVVLLGTLFVLSGVEHLCLKLVGVQTRVFETTLRAYCYSYAPAFLVLAPVVGSLLLFVWGLVCRGNAYRGLHETTGGKAALGMLLPWGLCCTGSLVLSGFLFAL